MANDEHRITGFLGLTPVVKNLVIINILFFFATIALLSSSRGQLDLNEYLALYYPGSDKFKWWQIITYMFMHANFSHIFFNMFALWMFGNILEQVWGSKRFFTYYMVTGIGAAVVHIAVMYYQFHSLDGQIQEYMVAPNPVDFANLLNKNFKGIYNPEWFDQFVGAWSITPDSPILKQESLNSLSHLVTTKMNIPTIGASGAVFGVLLAYGLIFPNSLIYIYFLLPIKAKWFVLIYAALEFWFGVSGAGDNVAHFAHLGGMIFGYLLLLYWHKKEHRYY